MADRLPEEVMQRITSFLNGEEAARTTILCKSWYGAWFTRPNLIFKQSLFQRHTDDYFFEFTTKTMQRYEDLKLNIDSLTLSMSKLESEVESSLAMELIERAMKLGAFDLDITLWNKSFDFPIEVLHRETLATLSLAGSFKINLQKLICSKLKSLTFSMDVEFDMFRDLISKFPLLETLLFVGQRLTNQREADSSDLGLGFPKLKLKFDTLNSQFQKLEYLCFDNLIVVGKLFSDPSSFSGFPCLKELVIWDCRFKDIRICNKSLERISIGFSEERMSHVTELHVPNIRKFKFQGRGWSGLALETTSRDWESDIGVTCNYPNNKWFISLEKLLKNLRGSKVCLSIHVIEDAGHCSGLVGLEAHVVESLMLEGFMVNPSFLDNLFLICRPKLIIREWHQSISYDSVYNYLMELVCKGVIERIPELHPTGQDHVLKYVYYPLSWRRDI